MPSINTFKFFTLFLLSNQLVFINSERVIEFIVCSFEDSEHERGKIYCLEGEANYCCHDIDPNTTAVRCCTFSELQDQNL
jgi:hypothetical protein